MPIFKTSNIFGIQRYHSTIFGSVIQANVMYVAIKPSDYVKNNIHTIKLSPGNIKADVMSIETYHEDLLEASAGL